MITINLLSPQEKTERVIAERYRYAYQILFAGAALIIGAIIILFAMQVFFTLHTRTVKEMVEAQETLVETPQVQALEKDVTTFNAYLKRIDALIMAHPAWSRILADIANRIPEGIQLTRLDAETKTGVINLGGKARTRDEVLALRTNILGSPFFTGANFPLANLEAERDIEFSYSFFLKEDALTKDL
ncbi:MAG: PilN domain-containing protein [Parcubacteria group bacterium]|nr:PilN domain-containing protein [Parcubacteria group bacterium]